MPIGQRPRLFKPRARLIGNVEWVCCFCGFINKSHLTPKAFRLQCKHRNCRRKFLFGLRFFEMPGGGKVRRPPDMIIPDWEAMPEAVLFPEPYKNGRPVHEMVGVEPDGDDHDIGAEQAE